MPATPAVQASGLTKRYGDLTALDGLDLTVPEGSVLGLLGPNGAGKTTAVSILTTLLQPDEGSATIAGADLATEPQLVRERIGLSGQYAAVDEVLTGFENLDMIGRLYRLGKQRSRDRARELLERFDLVDAGDRPVKTYSGGMRRRLDLAGALVAEPPVLFLDEPTTGLDPRSRIELWGVIRELVGRGATLLLTTQYLEEADQLADEILVIDHGRELARGTSDELKTQLGGERIEVTVDSPESIDAARAVLAGVAVGDVEVNVATRTLLAPIAGGVGSLSAALREFESRTIAVSDIGLRRPTLDDVFLTLTGSVPEPADSTPDPDQPTTEPEEVLS
ncbi:MAG: ATP-binding cassette domain-containing protein [Acidimicrobiales bacterium]|nr:ATP-binding cassette domain-containing protein [Acidimicrobiales bacterium]